MQVMCIGLGDEVLVRTLWVKSLWSIDSLAGASVSLFSHGIVTWPMIPTSDKKGGSRRCFWNQSSDFGKTVVAKYRKSNLYTLVVGGFGHHCFEQDLLKSLEYSTSCNTQVTLDWTQGRIFSAEVSMVDVNKHSRLELRVGVVALAAEGSSVLVFYKNSASSTCCSIFWKYGYRAARRRRSTSNCLKRKWSTLKEELRYWNSYQHGLSMMIHDIIKTEPVPG